MTSDERKVITESILWWNHKCPLNMTISEHLNTNPTVNCISEDEKRLAESIVILLKTKKCRSNHI